MKDTRRIHKRRVRARSSPGIANTMCCQFSIDWYYTAYHWRYVTCLRCLRNKPIARPTGRMIADRRQEIIVDLRTALSDSQRNHHRQSVARSGGHHHGSHWIVCQSESCVLTRHAIAKSRRRNAGR